MPSQQTLRCTFPAKQLLPTGCKNGDPVDIVVKGILQIDNPGPIFKFESTDQPNVIIVITSGDIAIEHSTRAGVRPLKYVSVFAP